MKTITAQIDGDTLIAEDGSRWKRVEGIEIGTRYEVWDVSGWSSSYWVPDDIDRFRKANDLIAWTEADKPRIENRQKAMLAAEEWFDANGRFEPDWENVNQVKWFMWADGDASRCLSAVPIGIRYVFETKADAEKFVADMGEHLKWL